MTMQSSGLIGIGQAMGECQIPQQQFNAGSSQLSKLAGVNPGNQYAWSYWYGKSNGYTITEMGPSTFYSDWYGGSCAANFGRGLPIYMPGWNVTGGDSTVWGNFPASGIGYQVFGLWRHANWVTLCCMNSSLDGCQFTSSLGETINCTNDLSYSAAFGPNLWTFYAGQSQTIGGGANRTYSVNMSGTINRPQPPNGYVNGVAPAPPPTNNSGGSPSGSCFVAGTLVLMADRSWKQIQTIQAGDMIMGPTGPALVKRLHVATVGHDRALLTFKEDRRHQWSAEHPYWVRQNGKQWWWSADHEQIHREIASGLLQGLKDPNSFLGGQVEYATLNGFVKRTPMVVPGYDPNTLVFIPVVEGSPCFVNGYMVSAFINEFNYDYTKLDWNDHQGGFAIDQQLLELNRGWIEKYHQYFEKQAA